MNRTIVTRSTGWTVGCCVLIALTSMPGRAYATFVGTLLDVQVSAGSDTGEWTLVIPTPDDPLLWQLNGPIDIYSSQNANTLLASIDDLTLQLNGDPQVLVNFAVTAGGTNTNFSISSALVAFSPLTNPQAFATAAVTVTDNDSNGATVSGSFPGSKAYEATYNGGTVFADLVSPVIAPVDSSNIGSQRNPLAGTIPIAGSVSSIAAGFSFVLTASDSASGTSRFSVVPEPSTVVLSLMAIAGLLWACRRK